MLNKDKIMEIEYKFDENTPPQEIVLSACLIIASFLEDKGYKYFKSKGQIIKKINVLKFSISFWSSDTNRKGL
jgi:hypothetical protein